jgi:hypothetical protein
MAAKRGKAPDLSINVTNAIEEQVAKFVRGTTPWIVWLLGLPLGALGFWLLARFSHHRHGVEYGLAAATVTVTWVMWRVSHARGAGRLHHALNAAGSLGWVTAVVTFGLSGLLLIVYAIGGLVMVLIWNVRYTTHSDAAEDVLTGPGVKGAKKVDVAYVIRVLAGRAPAIRASAEKIGRVVPAAVGPWREASPLAAVPAGEPHKAITADAADDASHLDAAAMARAAETWQRISRNFRRLAAQVPDMNGARIRALDVKPWRIRSEVALVRGVQTPKVITDHREQFASMNALPLSSVLAKANQRNHSKVFLDWVLEDILATVRYWPGPSAAGKSIADAPTRFGLYEDRVYAERFGPAITADMAKRLGRAEKNLSHLLSEGMNGAGKSTANRILVADAATRRDIEEWLVDTVKKLQTFGQLGQAFQWFAVTVPEAKSLVKFLASAVIPARADYLGAHGFDNWEPGCGLPYLRVTVEEGGIVANELDKLDAVLNSARSTGTEINLSAQRAHHALVDTNVRAAFGDTLSFGAKNIDDVFAMPDELRDAGADPSLWQNKQPGMNYYAAAGLDDDRRMMPDRGFNAAVAELRELVAEHEPARAEWIRQNCPDWARMLAEIDVNGVYAKRTTGAQVLAKIEAAERRKAGHAEVADDEPMGELVQMPPRPRPVMADDEEIVEATIVGEPQEDEEIPVSMDELDLENEVGGDVAGGVAEDEDIDPRKPLPPLDPAEALDFTAGRQRREMPREDALALLRRWLAAKGEGWVFAPRDIYEELCEATGRSASWIRTELSTTLVTEGLVLNDRMEGRYTVVRRAS